MTSPTIPPEPAMPELTPLLLRSWQRAWSALGAEGNGHGLMEAVLARYAEPQRHYHTVQHLSECLAMLESKLSLAMHPAEVEMALWFHDAVYEVRASDNEQQSASWAETALQAARVLPEVAARVRELVLVTRHASEPSNTDQQLLVDLDLAILGADPARFEEYERQVRQEYAWVNEPAYRQGRRAVLQRFLERPHIYGTPSLHAAREQQARGNLQRSIDCLGG